MIYLVLRGFVSPDVSSYGEKVDVVQDVQDINQELMLYVRLCPCVVCAPHLFYVMSVNVIL